MKKILWLCSWYPNRYAFHEGNFIQRQAQALSLYAKVHVLVVKDVQEKIKREEECFVKDNLTEQIIYYNGSSNTGFLKRVKSNIDFLNINKVAIYKYIQQNGMPDYVHVQVPVRAGMIALWMKRTFGTKYFVTEHYGIYNEAVEDPFKKRSWIYQRGVKRIISKAQTLIVVSKELGEDINECVTKKYFISIPNVVNTNLFSFSKNENQISKFIFLHISNMIPLKNVEGIFDAAKKLSDSGIDFELRIVGKKSETILDYVKKCGLPSTKFHFTGEIAYEKVAEEMQRANSLIMFSRSESASCVVQEALCCGLPVISTPVGIAKEIINEMNGLFVPINSVEGLTTSMIRMMETKNNYDREKISAEFSNQFSYEKVGKQIFDNYEL